MDFTEASQLINKYYPIVKLTGEYFSNVFNYGKGSVILPDGADEIYNLTDPDILKKWLKTCKKEFFEDLVQKGLLFPRILIMEQYVYPSFVKKLSVQDFIANQKELGMVFMPLDGICWSCHKNIIPRLIEKGQDGTKLVTGCPLCNRSYCD